MGRGFLEGIGVERFEVALVGVAQGLGRCRGHRQSDDRARWSLRARFDVPTFVRVLRCGALFIAAIMAAMTIKIHCCQSLAAAQARFPRIRPVCAATAIASFTCKQREQERNIQLSECRDGGIQGRCCRAGCGHGRRRRGPAPAAAGARCHPGRPARTCRRRNQFRQCGNDRVRLGVSLHVSAGSRTDPPPRPEPGAAGALQLRRSAELPAVAGALLSRLHAGPGASRCAGGDAADPPQPGRA